MEAQEIIHCRGHPLVSGKHPTTFEVTAESHLTSTGDCIIGIAADKGCAGLSAEFKNVLSHDDARLLTRLVCGDVIFEIHSRGSSQFTLVHPTDMVWRRSTFVCGRTIGILSDHATAPLPDELIKNLMGEKTMIVMLTATHPG
ncbi:MAG: DUF371 domain-containing protein [Methanomicrobiales archaeon]